MKQFRWVTPFVLGGFLVTASAEEAVKVESEEAKLAYSVGYDMGSRMREMPGLTDHAFFVRGVQDGVTETKPLLTEAEQEAVLETYYEKQLAEQQKLWDELSKANLDKEKAYLEEYKKQHSDAVTLPSGLIYRVIEAGSGEKPKLENTVVVEYTGRLPQGEVFDSSENHGGAVSLPLAQVIVGWQEALQMMEKGAKWELVIPSNLAYGESGAGGVIGPNQTLLFDIKLVDIQ